MPDARSVRPGVTGALAFDVRITSSVAEFLFGVLDGRWGLVDLVDRPAHVLSCGTLGAANSSLAGSALSLRLARDEACVEGARTPREDRCPVLRTSGREPKVRTTTASVYVRCSAERLSVTPAETPTPVGFACQSGRSCTD